MSKKAEALLEEFQKLPASEQQGLLKRLLETREMGSSRQPRTFPTVKLPGGRVTSEQVAGILEDE